jgi:hypothetical protein
VGQRVDEAGRPVHLQPQRQVGEQAHHSGVLARSGTQEVCFFLSIFSHILFLKKAHLF